LGILHDFAFSKRFLPSPVDLSVQLNSVAPSLRLRYRAFFTTARDSAPVPRFGTQALMGLPLELLPWHRDTGSHVPHKSLNRVHAVSPAGRRLSRKQVSLRLFPKLTTPPWFWRRPYAFDSSSTVCLRSSPRPLPDRVLPCRFRNAHHLGHWAEAASGGL